MWLLRRGTTKDAGLVDDITLDCDAFAREGDWQKATHAIGAIHNSDGTVARLIVIKLRLTETSNPILKAYHRKTPVGNGPSDAS